MSDKSQKSNNKEETKTIIIQNNTSNALGIASFVFGLISIFALAPVFVPLAIIFAILAIIKKQIAWGVTGIICSLIGFATSPILIGMFGAVTLFSNIDNTTSNTVPSSLTIQTIDGDLLDVDKLKGSPYLLTFWSPSNPGSVAEIPRLTKLEEKTRGTGFHIIAVAMSDSDLTEIQNMRSRKNINYIIGVDQTAKLENQFDIKVMPTSFLVNNDGQIISRKLGEWDENELEEKVSSLF